METRSLKIVINEVTVHNQSMSTLISVWSVIVIYGSLVTLLFGITIGGNKGDTILKLLSATIVLFLVAIDCWFPGCASTRYTMRLGFGSYRKQSFNRRVEPKVKALFF